MSNALLIHDLADAIVRQRHQEAAQQALLAQLPAAARLIIFLLVVLNLAATRWGFDSRAAFRLIRH